MAENRNTLSANTIQQILDAADGKYPVGVRLTLSGGPAETVCCSSSELVLFLQEHHFRNTFDLAAISPFDD